MKEVKLISVAEMYRVMQDMHASKHLGERLLYTDPDGIAVLITNDGKPEQMLLATINDEDIYQTNAIVGEWTQASLELFDMLCAAGSRHYPPIVEHHFYVEEAQRPAFDLAFSKSRLGRFQVAREDFPDYIKIDIKYPYGVTSR